MSGNEPFASRLREARLRKGARLKAAGWLKRYTQELVALNIGIAEESATSRINHYEKGRHLPDLETAKRLAQELDIPLAFLFCDDNYMAEILLLIHQLSPRKKKQALNAIQSLLDQSAG